VVDDHGETAVEKTHV